MRRNSNQKAIVSVDLRQNNGKKTTREQLEGVSQQLLGSGTRRVATVSRRSKKSAKQHPERMATALVPSPRFPPAFDACPVYRVKHRWVSAENVAISSAAFTLALGHFQFKVNTTTTAIVSYVSMWRIRKISIWTINYVDNGTTASLQPVGTDIDTNSYNDRDVIYTCSSRSEAEPGHMAIRPAKDTPLGSWHKTSTVNPTGSLFTLTVDTGGASSGNWATTTMDIDFDFIINTIGAPEGYTNTTGATTAGTLSGSNLFANAMILQSVNSIQ